MKHRFLFCVVILLLGNFWSYAQHKVAVTVYGVQSNAGNVCFAVYKTADNFLKDDSVYISGKEKASMGKVDFSINNLPEGKYAIAIFHDENNNEKLDTNLLGIPKEKVAFSNAKMRTFGPPKFADCAFSVNSYTEIRIEIN